MKCFHDKDYDEDWSKLGPWGEDYERLNNAPGPSRFDMMIDDQNRSVIKSLGPWGLLSVGPKGPLLSCPLEYGWAHDDSLVRSQV